MEASFIYILLLLILISIFALFWFRPIKCRIFLFNELFVLVKINKNAHRPQNEKCRPTFLQQVWAKYNKNLPTKGCKCEISNSVTEEIERLEGGGDFREGFFFFGRLASSTLLLSTSCGVTMTLVTPVKKKETDLGWKITIFKRGSPSAQKTLVSKQWNKELYLYIFYILHIKRKEVLLKFAIKLSNLSITTFFAHLNHLNLIIIFISNIFRDSAELISDASTGSHFPPTSYHCFWLLLTAQRGGGVWWVFAAPVAPWNPLSAETRCVSVFVWPVLHLHCPLLIVLRLRSWLSKASHTHRHIATSLSFRLSLSLSRPRIFVSFTPAYLRLLCHFNSANEPRKIAFTLVFWFLN